MNYKEFEDFVNDKLRPDSVVTRSFLCFNTILKTKDYEQLALIMDDLKDIFNGRICAKPTDPKEQLVILRFIQAKMTAGFKSIVQELKNKE